MCNMPYCHDYEMLRKISRLGRSRLSPSKVKAEIESDLVISHRKRESCHNSPPEHLIQEVIAHRSRLAKV